MTCPHCERRMAVIERQGDEIRRLRRELGFQREAGNIGALMAALDLPPAKARLLLRLYAGGGRAVTHEALLETIREDATDNALKVHMSQLRAKLGEDAIITARAVGYALGIPMVSRCLAILEPPEIQDAKPA